MALAIGQTTPERDDVSEIGIWLYVRDRGVFVLPNVHIEICSRGRGRKAIIDNDLRQMYQLNYHYLIFD